MGPAMSMVFMMVSVLVAAIPNEGKVPAWPHVYWRGGRLRREFPSFGIGQGEVGLVELLRLGGADEGEGLAARVEGGGDPVEVAGADFALMARGRVAVCL